jgi:ATP-dependent DNA helicase RecQ
MNENDHFKQSEKIKEYIYYYFNARYSREGNTAIINNITINADLNKDFKENLETFEMIKKYIEIVEKDDNGNIINNLKHLRGATMKILRAYNNIPQINILKAFSLCLISNNYQSNEFRQLQEEAKKELLTGIQLWKEIEKTFDYPEFIKYFSQKIYEHIALESKHIFEDFFNEIDDIFYMDDIIQWLKNFNNKFLYNYSSN